MVHAERRARQRAPRNRFAQRRGDDRRRRPPPARSEKPQAADQSERGDVGAEEMQRRHREHDCGGQRHQGERADHRRSQRLDRPQIPGDRRRAGRRARSLQVPPHLLHAAKRAGLRGVDANPQPRGNLDEAPAFDVMEQQRLPLIRRHLRPARAALRPSRPACADRRAARRSISRRPRALPRNAAGGPVLRRFIRYTCRAMAKTHGVTGRPGS